MSETRFTTTLSRSEETGSGVLLTLPSEASAKLPSRGTAMVEGTLNGRPFRGVLEPDGKGSHWFVVNAALLEAARAELGDSVVLVFGPSKEWLEPKVPAGLMDSLILDPEAQAIWSDITPSARWDWVRWIGSAKQAETRQRRVESVCSRLKSGKRRPCCFDRNQCTLTEPEK
ncbi:MAG: YdeI/OmpD-associated family protein [Armatimonadota bacterium]